jgi:hypothetical protein
MTKETSQLVKEGTLTPITDLASLQDDDQDDFKEGFVMAHIPDMMTRSHTALLTREEPNRCPRILARAEHSQYLIFPTAFSSPKVMRIISILYRFITAFKSKWSKAIVTTDAHPSPPPSSGSSALTSSAWEEYPTGSPQARSGYQIPPKIS